MAYNLSSLVTKVQKRVRDTGYSSTTIKEFINDAQNDVFGQYTLRQMESTAYYILTIGDSNIAVASALPTAFSRAITLRNVTSGLSSPIEYVDAKLIDQRYPDPSSDAKGAPRYWYFYGNTIRVYPEPDAAYQLELKYLRQPTELSLDGDVPEIPQEFGELLVYGAAYRVFEEKDMDDKASVFERKYLQKVAQFVNRYALRQPGPVYMNLYRRGAGHAQSIFK